MDFLEKDLEDIIWDASQTDDGRQLLFERGLRINGKLYRQVSLGQYGRLDLASVEIYCDRIDINVFELKKDLIDISTMLQAAKYATAIERYYDRILNINRTLNISITLIGREMDLSNNFPFLYNLSPTFSIYLYSYKLDGLHFNYQSKYFHFTSEDFGEINFDISKQDIIEMKERIIDIPF